MNAWWHPWLAGLLGLGGLLAVVELGFVMLFGSAAPAAGEDF